MSTIGGPFCVKVNSPSECVQYMYLTAKPLTARPLTAKPLTAMALGVADAAAAWTPLSLFAAGEQGAYYDPSDFSTMWQDSARTTPVTTFGQPVGAINDKSGNGNHATQATSSKRPVTGRVPFGGRRNLLLATDTLSTQSYTTTAVAHCLSFTGTGTITLTGASTAGPLVGTGVSDRVSLSFTPTAASLTLTVSGSVTFAQLERGSTPTAYQKVTTEFDVTESGKADCWYIQGDGVDDTLGTASVSFGATDELTLAAGVITPSYTSGNKVVLVGNYGGSGTGNGYLTTNNSGPSGTNLFLIRGTTNNQSRFNDPTNFSQTVLTGMGKISTDYGVIRKNGVQRATSAEDAGTGNIGVFPIWLFSNALGAIEFFNGSAFSIIVRALMCAGDELTEMEAWIANKTGVTL